jgi:hypothetical protein
VVFVEPITVGYIVKDSCAHHEGVFCDDSCEFAFNGVCDDSSGSVVKKLDACLAGTDCTDCGGVDALPAPESPPQVTPSSPATKGQSGSDSAGQNGWIRTFVVSFVLSFSIVLSVMLGVGFALVVWWHKADKTDIKEMTRYSKVFQNDVEMSEVKCVAPFEVQHEE